LHPDALNHDCRVTGKAGKQALQCTGPGAVAPRTKGRLAAAIRQREFHDPPAGSFRRADLFCILVLQGALGHDCSLCNAASFCSL